MVSKRRAKGNRSRLKVIKSFEDRGWKVAIVERTGRFIKEKDMFGIWDLFCVNTTGQITFVQVSTNVPHPHKAFKEFKAKYFWKSNEFISFEQHCCIDGGEVKKWVY